MTHTVQQLIMLAGDKVRTFLNFAATTAALGTIFAGSASVSAYAADSAWSATFNTEARYFWSAADGGLNQRVQQVYTPVGLQVAGKPHEDWKFDNILRSGHIWSQTQSGATQGRYTGWTDTTLGTTATYLGLTGFQPFLSINVNMPTGQTVLRGSQSFARNLDSDVVDTPSFGEGWNIGATLGTAISVSNELMVTISGGYTYRGPYLREGFNTVTFADVNRFDPGDTLAANIEAAYTSGAWSLSASGSYSHETATTIDYLDFYRSGDRYSASASAGYAWNKNWSSKLATTFTHSVKNRIFDVTVSTTNLVLEAFNSNSNVARVTFDSTYSDGPFAITPVVGFLYRDHNAYDGTNQRFLPAKTKWWVGSSVEYKASDKLVVTGRVERMWLRESDNPDKLFGSIIAPGTGTALTSTNAWLTSIAALYRF